jgi:hypothetical protein
MNIWSCEGRRMSRIKDFTMCSSRNISDIPISRRMGLARLVEGKE